MNGVNEQQVHRMDEQEAYRFLVERMETGA